MERSGGLEPALAPAAPYIAGIAAAYLAVSVLLWLAGEMTRLAVDAALAAGRRRGRARSPGPRAGQPDAAFAGLAARGEARPGAGAAVLRAGGGAARRHHRAGRAAAARPPGARSALVGPQPTASGLRQQHRARH